MYIRFTQFRCQGKQMKGPQNNRDNFQKTLEIGMSFYYFTPNNYSLLQNLDLCQNYNTQIQNFINPFHQSCYDLMQWNQTLRNQKSSLLEQKIPIAQLSNTESCPESEISVEIKRRWKRSKKRLGKTVKKQISSAKKNSQSNIINQFYSFFGFRQKSQKITKRAIQASCPNTQSEEKIIILFYNTIRAINAKRGRKYVNRGMMVNYFTSEILIENVPEIGQKLEKVDFITLEELCQIFRRCCQAFLKVVSIPALLTSKRITGISKQEHFKKRRKILKAITAKY